MLKGHMLRGQPLQRLRQIGHFHCAARVSAASETLQASKPEKLLPAVPGTVKEYQQHIMIQTAPLTNDSSAKESHSVHGCWWPSVVEKHPAVIEAIAAAARSKGTVKVTTFEESTRDTFLESGRPVCDLRVYPAGVQYLDLPINMVRQVTAAHMDLTSDEDLDDTVEVSNSSQLEAVQHLQQPLDGLHLYVCCHGSRDTRCGKLGNNLVRKLDNLIQQQQLQETVQVFKCSHVGGHKYAGNVLVYGAMSPCDGDWFGGVNDSNAAAFLNGVINAEFGSEGGAEEPALRYLWRGRMGTSREQQLDLFMGRTASDEESSDADDLQHSGSQSLQASHSATTDARRISSDNASASSQDHYCACQHENSTGSSGTDSPDIVDSKAHDALDTNDDGTEPDSSSSDAETSSSSESESSSEGSDDDPDTMPPIEVQ